MSESEGIYRDAMKAIFEVQRATTIVLNRWLDRPPLWNKPPTDQTICHAIREQLGVHMEDISNHLRGFARHVLAIHANANFRKDLALLRYLLCEENQARFRNRLPKPPDSPARKTLVAAHGYDFLRVYNWPQFEGDVLSRYDVDDDDASLEGWKDLFNARLQANEERGQPWVYIPEARYDEIFIEVLTGTWLALFFVGERYDVLWSIVVRTSANETGGLPSGCSVFKAYGDVYREMREAAEEIIFRRGEQSLLNSNCRIRSVVHWPVFFGEPVFAPNAEKGPFDLTPPQLRSLGALYLYWQGLRYVRAGLPITLLMRKKRFDEIAPALKDALDETKHSEEWKSARKWFTLAFGNALDPSHGPVCQDTRESLEKRGVKECKKWVAWYSSNQDPKQIHADLLSSRHTVILAIDDTEINKLELQNAACGPRIGAASGGSVIQWQETKRERGRTGDQEPITGELPFSGRRLYGDLLASYNYAFRLLARQGRDWVVDSDDLAIDVLARVYGRPAPAARPDLDGQPEDSQAFD